MTKLRLLALNYKNQDGHEDEMNAVVDKINEGNMQQAALLWADLPARYKFLVAADIGAMGDGRMVIKMSDHL